MNVDAMLAPGSPSYRAMHAETLYAAVLDAKNLTSYESSGWGGGGSKSGGGLRYAAYAAGIRRRRSSTTYAEEAIRGEEIDARVSERAARAAARRAQPGFGLAKMMTPRDFAIPTTLGRRRRRRRLRRVLLGVKKKKKAGKGKEGGGDDGGGDSGAAGGEGGAAAAVRGGGGERVDSYDTPALLRLDGEMEDPHTERYSRMS